jgi:hypothetical protein
MNRSISIISTLIEAAKFGSRLPRTILVLALICSLPSITTQWLASGWLSPKLTKDPSHAGGYVVAVAAVSFATIVVQIVVEAAATASILGLLKSPASGTAAWATIGASVRRYTWPLIILAILLSIIACLVMIPASLLAVFLAGNGHPPGASSYMLGLFSMFGAILFLVFAKYALADPLVVVENLNPLRALARSWRMTRGHFWYVLGCYIFVGTAEYFLNQLAAHFELPQQFTWIDAIDCFTSSLFTCYWILLAWVMYLRIQAADSPGPPPVPATA